MVENLQFCTTVSYIGMSYGAKLYLNNKKNLNVIDSFTKYQNN